MSGTAGRDGADRERLAGALETIIDVLVGGDLESVKRSVEELESGLSGRVEEIDGLLANLSQRLEETRSTTDQRIRAAQDEMKSGLETTEGSLNDAIAKLNEQISDLRRGIEQQAEASARASAVLENLATVFSATGGVRPGPAPEEPSPEPRTAKAPPKPPTGQKRASNRARIESKEAEIDLETNLDDTIDQMLSLEL